MVGQHVDFGQFKNVRFSGGIHYASLGNTIRLKVPSAVNYRADVNYQGLGPRVGTDFSYAFNNGFAVYANGAASLTLGTSKFKTVSNETLFVNGSRKAIVPEVDAKIGANYSHMMGSGHLTIDAGYMVTNYFNAITSATLDDSDFGVQGPYFGLKWVGYMA